MEQFFYLPSSMLWPLAACLVLTGIHVYLGVHVVARKVIFVDLALAQIAALGTVIGILLGYEAGTDSTPLYLYSLAFTIFGAFVFSITRMKGEKVPHEAMIGIVYAVTFAATMLVMSRSALGPQELDHILKGELLWVQGPTVIKTALIYAAVGIFHFIFRNKFIAISFDQSRAELSGVNVRLWDFLFYMSFGFVITSSVAIAGVFLVFSYLVIPAVGAMLLTENLGKRLAIGWIGGSVCSFIGVKLSWDTGLPTSPLVVCVLAGALILGALYRYVTSHERKVVAIRRILLGTAVVGIFGTGVVLFQKGAEDPLEHAIHMLESRLPTDRMSAFTILEAHPEAKSQWLPVVLERLNDTDAEVRAAAVALLARAGERDALPEITKLLSDPSDIVRLRAVEAIRTLGTQSDAAVLLQSAEREEDPELRLAMLRSALSVGSVDAIAPLIAVAEEGSVFSSDALEALKQALPVSVQTYDTAGLRRWLESKGSRLTWNVTEGRFRVRE